MKLVLFIFMNLLICTGFCQAEDQLGDFIVKIKDVKYDKTLKELWPIVDYLEKKKEFTEKEIEEIKKIVLIYCEEKELAVYLPSIIKITLLLKKEDLKFIKPVLLRILEDPKQRNIGARLILENLNYLFDDYNGEMLLKYGELIKISPSDFIFLIFYSAGKFNDLKLKTFRSFFINILDGNERLVQYKLYRELKDRFAFVNSMSATSFEKSADEIKLQEIKKLKDWLVVTTDIEVAFAKFFSDFNLKISSLTPDSFDREIELWRQNFEFLKWMPSKSDILLDPFNEKDKGYSEGIKTITEEMKKWFDLHKGGFDYCSNYQIDLLFRAIHEKMREKRDLFKGDTIYDLDFYKKKALAVKLGMNDKTDTIAGLRADAFINELKTVLKSLKSEPYKAHFGALLNEMEKICPPPLEPLKSNFVPVFTEGILNLEVSFADNKIKIDENGLNIKLTIQNCNNEAIEIADGFNLDLNFCIVFLNKKTNEKIELGNSRPKIAKDSKVVYNFTSIEPNSKREITISDLVEKSKKLILPKGEYEIVVYFYFIRGEKKYFTGISSSKVIAIKE